MWMLSSDWPEKTRESIYEPPSIKSPSSRHYGSLQHPEHASLVRRVLGSDDPPDCSFGRYWAQRLLWEVGSFSTFFPPNAVQFRNSHSYLDDFIDERELYHQSSDFVEFLVNWKSDKTNFLDTMALLHLFWRTKKFD